MRNIISPILCVLYLTIFVGTGSSSVLCVGENGHVAIESGIQGSCADTSHESNDTSDCELSVSEPHCHCGPCVDIPLEFELAESRQDSFEVIVQLNTDSWSPVLLETSATAFLKTATVTNLPIPPPIDHNPSLLSIRTVVLLI